MHIKYFITVLALSVGLCLPAGDVTAKEKLPPLMIQEQGSFAAGGKIVTTPGTFDPRTPTNPAGQTLHGDHAYVFYQIPVNAHKLPLVFLHGAGQFSKTWESTPDGREGFQNIFLRRGFGVYLVDQPRRGDAGRSTQETTISATTDDQLWFGNFRVGNWPDFFEGVQFPRDAESLNQYFRQMTPNTGPFDVQVVSDPEAAMFDTERPGIIVTHTQGPGGRTKTPNKTQNHPPKETKEPGSNFPFPEDEMPPALPSGIDTLEGVPVPLKDFMKLTRIPIIIYYGDFIPATRSEFPGPDHWRTRLQMARVWADAVNNKGGDVTVVHLPEIGIKGNTHFPFSDLNNLEIADLLSKWFHEKNLDQ